MVNRTMGYARECSTVHRGTHVVRYVVLAIAHEFTRRSVPTVHYAINALAANIISRISLPVLTFTLNFRFLLWFLVVDFVLNILVYISASQSFGVKRLMKHILYGTYNTKTYFVVVIGWLSGLEVDMWVWLLTGILTRAFVETAGPDIIKRALHMPCFRVLFYCEHRINHCPVVYGHAHKQHHYLHDSTAFDAHVYGNGMNEEWFWIMAECVPAIASGGVLMPYFLNLETLYQSFTNKGAHTRSANCQDAAVLDFDIDNFHANHHTLHNKNFGSSTCIFIDVYFGTASKGAVGVAACTYELSDSDSDNVCTWSIRKIESGKGKSVN